MLAQPRAQAQRRGHHCATCSCTCVHCAPPRCEMTLGGEAPSVPLSMDVSILLVYCKYETAVDRGAGVRRAGTARIVCAQAMSSSCGVMRRRARARYHSGAPWMTHRGADRKGDTAGRLPPNEERESRKVGKLKLGKNCPDRNNVDQADRHCSDRDNFRNGTFCTPARFCAQCWRTL